MTKRKAKSRTLDDRSYLIGTVLGISVGAIFCLSGFVIVILGFTGTIEWIVEGINFSSKLTNAGPGVFFALLGAVILWRYKPRTFSHQMRDELLGRSWNLDILEHKTMPYEAGHMKELMKMFESSRVDESSSPTRVPSLDTTPGSQDDSKSTLTKEGGDKIDSKS